MFVHFIGFQALLLFFASPEYNYAYYKDQDTKSQRVSVILPGSTAGNGRGAASSLIVLFLSSILSYLLVTARKAHSSLTCNQGMAPCTVAAGTGLSGGIYAVTH